MRTRRTSIGVLLLASLLANTSVFAQTRPASELPDETDSRSDPAEGRSWNRPTPTGVMRETVEPHVPTPAECGARADGCTPVRNDANSRLPEMIRGLVPDRA